MRFLPYIVTNIQKLIKQKPLLFFFLIISQIVCVVVVLMICGLVYNAYMAEKEISQGEKTFEVILGQYYIYDATDEWTDENGQKYSDEIYYVKDLKPKFDEIIEFLGEDFDYISFWGTVKNGPSITFSSSIKSSDCEYESEQLKKFDNSKDRIIRLDPYSNIDYFDKLLKVGDSIDINGIEYKVSITERGVGHLYMPYNALQDDKFVVKTIYVGLKNVCTNERNREIEAKIEELFGHKEIKSPIIRDLQEQQNRNLVYTITAAIILMVLLNISRVYSYILSYRKKTFAVMAICGANKFKIFMMYLIELMLTLVVTYVLGTLIFHFTLFPILGNMYSNILLFISKEVYMTIFAIYIIAAFIIMSITISVFISKSSVDMKRSGK